MFDWAERSSEWKRATLLYQHSMKPTDLGNWNRIGRAEEEQYVSQTIIRIQFKPILPL